MLVALCVRLLLQCAVGPAAAVVPGGSGSACAVPRGSGAAPCRPLLVALSVWQCAVNTFDCIDERLLCAAYCTRCKSIMANPNPYALKYSPAPKSPAVVTLADGSASRRKYVPGSARMASSSPGVRRNLSVTELCTQDNDSVGPNPPAGAAAHSPRPAEHGGRMTAGASAQVANALPSREASTPARIPPEMAPPSSASSSVSTSASKPCDNQESLITKEFVKHRKNIMNLAEDALAAWIKHGPDPKTFENQEVIQNVVKQMCLTMDAASDLMRLQGRKTRC